MRKRLVAFCTEHGYDIDGRAVQYSELSGLEMPEIDIEEVANMTLSLYQLHTGLAQPGRVSGSTWLKGHSQLIIFERIYSLWLCQACAATDWC